MSENNFEEVLSELSERLLDLIISELRDAHGVRIEDAITVAGALAGCYLLKDSPAELTALTPGTTVLVDQLKEDGPRLLTLMQRFASQLGLNGEQGWDVQVPPGSLPSLDIPKLLTRFEPEASRIFNRLGIEKDMRAGIMALTAVRLIFDGKEILPEDFGKSLALGALISASRTVPPR